MGRPCGFLSGNLRRCATRLEGGGGAGASLGAAKFLANESQRSGPAAPALEQRTKPPALLQDLLSQRCSKNTPATSPPPTAASTTSTAASTATSPPSTARSTARSTATFPLSTTTPPAESNRLSPAAIALSIAVRDTPSQLPPKDSTTESTSGI
ncbi:hypothetical protein D9613_012946 [Agrocybe pediades]|uniref:Uncharacterized protein n=1 Tax=Agrocybe pediades TaxID=84607 RepID=A0A8H4QEI2_9AGAR|nr:hypothetical protein D9613_012946 [Agrocybe pediades]